MAKLDRKEVRNLLLDKLFIGSSSLVHCETVIYLHVFKKYSYPLKLFDSVMLQPHTWIIHTCLIGIVWFYK